MADQAAPSCIPVSCEVHSEYELAIMHKQPVEMTWRGDDGQVCSGLIMPLDLQSRNHKEFLLAVCLITPG